MELRESKILVLAGGLSGEREISLRSGRGCLDALIRLGFNAELIDLTKPEQLFTEKENNPNLIAFLCTHGAFGEDGRLQGFLEWLQIPYTGSGVLASALCMNKYLTREVLKAQDIQVAKGFTLNEYKKHKEQISFPVMLKPISEGSSIGVEKIDSAEILEAKIAGCYDNLNEWLIEEFVEGREITVSLLQKEEELEVLPILELESTNAFYDLEAKYTKGKTKFILPAPLKEEKQNQIEEIAKQVFNAVGCKGFARVDMILKKDILTPYVLEVNTLPGMTETSDLPAQAKETGLSYDDLVSFMLQSAQLKK